MSSMSDEVFQTAAAGKICPQCKTENTADARFCASCGAKLTADPADADAPGGPGSEAFPSAPQQAADTAAAPVPGGDRAEVFPSAPEEAAEEALMQRVSPEEMKAHFKATVREAFSHIPTDEAASDDDNPLAEGLPDWDLEPPVILKPRKKG